jgi:hypothetical protein
MDLYLLSNEFEIIPESFTTIFAESGLQSKESLSELRVFTDKNDSMEV